MTAASEQDSDLRLVVVAGPNGSGKSTITAIHQELHDLPAAYVNADEIAKALGIPAYDAAQVAEMKRSELIAAKQPFAFETVLSHPSKLALLDKAKEAGYDITLIFVGTQDPAINLQRVEQRARAGGHDVPPDKTVSRWHRSMELLPAAVERAGASLIYDNSGAAPNLVLQLEKTKIVERAEKVPPWVDVALVQPLQQRAAELKKLKSFANVNDLTLQKADATGQAYEGRMQVQTEHFITQNIGHRTLVVHDKAFVGKDLQPGQALRVDYSQYKPSGNTPLITHMGPAKGKDLGR
jgi:predicted ABC-type ATPase